MDQGSFASAMVTATGGFPDSDNVLTGNDNKDNNTGDVVTDTEKAMEAMPTKKESTKSDTELKDNNEADKSKFARDSGDGVDGAGFVQAHHGDSTRLKAESTETLSTTDNFILLSTEHHSKKNGLCFKW